MTAVAVTMKMANEPWVEAALRPGVSVARMAQEHGINANLLRKCITKYLMERGKGISPTPQDNGDDLLPSDNATDSLAIDPPSSHQRVVAAAHHPRSGLSSRSRLRPHRHPRR
ncbi:MAG: Mobile element protein [uncultured Paraburkholderia sp.]|nr:MAG: Mobile element protein [uncultured Paraburkholderia sp.]CAH2941970.1 MAG: Mobile element protein [uncultured Paraburkholderia sp.]